MSLELPHGHMLFTRSLETFAFFRGIPCSVEINDHVLLFSQNPRWLSHAQTFCHWLGHQVKLQGRACVFQCEKSLAEAVFSRRDPKQNIHCRCRNSDYWQEWKLYFGKNIITLVLYVPLHCFMQQASISSRSCTGVFCNGETGRVSGNAQVNSFEPSRETRPASFWSKRRLAKFAI